MTLRLKLLLPALLLLLGAVAARNPMLAGVAAALLVAQGLVHERWVMHGLREWQALLPRLGGLERGRAETEAECRSLRQRSQDAEAALRLTEQRYLLAVRGANDGVWELDVERQVIELSPRWKHLVGLDPEIDRITLADWLERVHVDDRKAAEQALAGHLEGTHERSEIALRLRHADGEHRWLLSRTAAIRHASGKPCRVIGLDTDITRLKRVESIVEAIAHGTAGAAGEAFFRALVEHFATALRIDCAFVTECDVAPASRVRTLAMWRRGCLAENIEYALAGTPCERVIGEQRCVFVPDGLAQQYPAEAGQASYIGLPLIARDGGVLGHLAFVHSRPMSDDMLMESVFRIFAARAAVELELAHALRRLQ